MAPDGLSRREALLAAATDGQRHPEPMEESI